MSDWGEWVVVGEERETLVSVEGGCLAEEGRSNEVRVEECRASEAFARVSRRSPAPNRPDSAECAHGPDCACASSHVGRAPRVRLAACEAVNLGRMPLRLTQLAISKSAERREFVVALDFAQWRVQRGWSRLSSCE